MCINNINDKKIMMIKTMIIKNNNDSKIFFNMKTMINEYL